jgi:hypothetical protein
MNNGIKYKIAYKVSIATFLTISLLLASVLWAQFWPFTPVEFEKVVLEYDTVKADDVIVYTSYFKKHVNRVGNMTRYLISQNGESVITLSTSLVLSKTTDRQKVVVVWIPSWVKPGKYKIKWVVTYDYFGIRMVEASAETPIFTVVN